MSEDTRGSTRVKGTLRSVDGRVWSAWRTATTPTSTTSGRRSPTRSDGPLGRRRGGGPRVGGGSVRASRAGGKGRRVDVRASAAAAGDDGAGGGGRDRHRGRARRRRRPDPPGGRGAWLPLDEVAAHGAGWQAHVEDLAAHVEGRERVEWRTRWTEPLRRTASRRWSRRAAGRPARGCCRAAWRVVTCRRTCRTRRTWCCTARACWGSRRPRASRHATGSTPAWRASCCWTSRRTDGSSMQLAGKPGWSLTEPGRSEDERRLALELDRAGARDVVTALHAEFVPLNRRFADACTNWQMRPTRVDPMAQNDHTDWTWDERVLGTLASLGQALRPARRPARGPPATLRRLRRPVLFRPREGRHRRATLDRRPRPRLLPHRVDAAPRGPARDPRRPTRAGQLTAGPGCVADGGLTRRAAGP